MQYGVCAHKNMSQWVCIGLPSYGPLAFIAFAQDDPWNRVVDDSTSLRPSGLPGSTEPYT
jgi:hypothetical protein